MRISTLQVLAFAIGQTVLALDDGDADAMYNGFNDAFLMTSGDDVYYKLALNNGDPDDSWRGALDILGVTDVYERTGNPDLKDFINSLLTTWLTSTCPPPWDWDGWNDDLGWFTLTLVRGYQITLNETYLDQAKAGFDYAFNRGWDTQYNDGGIWEENPEYLDSSDTPAKEALSNDSLGKVACYIYQSTNDRDYLDKAVQIYDWVRTNLFNEDTGQINRAVYEDGSVDTSAATYSQGTWLDYANLLYMITGDEKYYDDAIKTINFARYNISDDGIFNDDEPGRGAGHFVQNNQLWDTYYSWMVYNADTILKNRRSDPQITWFQWDQPTPEDDDTIEPNDAVGAMVWLQHTPATQPSEVGGRHVITNNMTGLAIDSNGAYGNGNGVIQWALDWNPNQRWILTQNSEDSSWNIVNVATWLALDCPDGSDEDGLQMWQWDNNRDPSQRWAIDLQDDGTYKITNQESGMVLDGGSNSTNGAALIQSSWSGDSAQRWNLG